MNISESYRYLREALTTIYDQREAGNISDIVVEKITGLKRIDRLLMQDKDLTPPQIQLLHLYTEKLIGHEPLQYVLQEAWFYGMSLYVDRNVLIPRPETEELAEWIITEQKNAKTILDIGTGSGCIAIAIKKSLPSAEVWAIDISHSALIVAQKNAQIQKTEINFRQADILQEISESSFPKFDIIVSNPPYIPASGEKEMRKNVIQFEPHEALFVSDDSPLKFYSSIARFATTNLKANGEVYVEIHEDLADGVKNIFTTAGLSNIFIRKDMQGKNRMIKAGGK
ncbi:MAG: peptide chain release factor N(5)-glutamine methyltransferase [Bacteroidetes bacterium]|nr:peptide chain release factor N(5)-glutamine methyltransferase [Bacteroidota bacterium]